VLSSRGDNNDDLELEFESGDSFNDSIAKKTITLPLTARIADKEKLLISPRAQRNNNEKSRRVISNIRSNQSSQVEILS
jgi:hypothetical protein